MPRMRVPSAVRVRVRAGQGAVGGVKGTHRVACPFSGYVRASLGARPGGCGSARVIPQAASGPSFIRGDRSLHG